MMKKTFVPAATAAVLALMSGCTKVGPDFHRIEPPELPKNWSQARADENATLSWWKIFHDDTLDRLIQTVYAQNLDLQSAGLRILQARAALGVSEGLRYPQVQQLSGNAAWSHRYERNFTSAAASFDLGWETDLWGKYARGIESSEASLYASVMSYRDLMVSVIAETVRSYIAYRTAEERMAYARRNIAIQERVTEMTRVQYNSGNVSELDMQQSRTTLYTTRATLPAIELTKIKARNALAVLLATTPEHVDALLEHGGEQRRDTLKSYLDTDRHDIVRLREDPKSYELFLIPEARFDPATKIDAALLLRRPDLKAAEYRAHALSAQIGVATAELYPSFSLFGTIGYSSSDLTGNWVAAPKALGVSFGPSFSWNIWQYDRIKNRIRIQDARFEEALVAYDKKVIRAVADVSSAMHGYNLTKAQLVESEKALEATLRAFNLSVTQYNNGLVSYQRLLSTVESLTRTQDRYAQIRGALATNAIALYKALGGGWQLSNGRRYVGSARAEQMKKRTDWGSYLDDNATRLPGEKR